MNVTLKNSPVIVALVGITLLAAALACNPMSALNQNVPPTPTLYEFPTVVSSGTGGTTGGSTGGTTGGAEASGDTLSLQSAEASGFTSFRSTFTLSYNGVDSAGSPVVGTVTFAHAYTTNPPAQQLTGTGDGNVGDPNTQNYDIVQIGTQTYSITNDPNGNPVCLAMSGGNYPPTQSPDQFLNSADLSKARRILPDETVNGVLSQHWQFNKDEVALLGGEWDNYTVDVWLAVDGKYTTKATFSGDGKQLTFKGGSGHVDWTYDLLEVNTVAEIKPPAGCTESTFPQMPDASDVISFGDSVSYFTASPVVDVVVFYNTTLPGLGWTPAEADTSNPAAAVLKFTKDGKTATISISDAGGKTNVTVLIQ